MTHYIAYIKRTIVTIKGLVTIKVVTTMSTEIFMYKFNNTLISKSLCIMYVLLTWEEKGDIL